MLTPISDPFQSDIGVSEVMLNPTFQSDIGGSEVMLNPISHPFQSDIGGSEVMLNPISHPFQSDIGGSEVMLNWILFITDSGLSSYLWVRCMLMHSPVEAVPTRLRAPRKSAN